jgi:hypothetical protein
MCEMNNGEGKIFAQSLLGKSKAALFLVIQLPNPRLQPGYAFIASHAGQGRFFDLKIFFLKKV